MLFPGYLHVIDGRLRAKLREVKGSPELAAKVEHSLHKTKGIKEVRANPVTGSVLVLFDSAVINSEKVLRHLSKFGNSETSKSLPVKQRENQRVQFEETLRNVILQTAAEVAVKRLIFAFL